MLFKGSSDLAEWHKSESTTPQSMKIYGKREFPCLIARYFYMAIDKEGVGNISNPPTLSNCSSSIMKTQSY